MKKQKFTGKLSLNKETISKLQDGQMVRIVGGSDNLCHSITGAHACCPPPPDTNTIIIGDVPDTIVNCCTHCNCP